MSINIPPEGRGAINLVAWCLIASSWRECLIVDAFAHSLTAEVIIKGTLSAHIVPFWHIQNVCLKYDDGTVIESFGAPRVGNPESIAYATGYREAYAEAL